MHGSVRMFVLLCKQIRAESAFSIKEEILAGYLKRFTGDVVLLFRLLLPNQHHRKYFLQDKQLVKIFARLFKIPEKKIQDEVNSTGDVAKAISDIYRGSGKGKGKSTMTLATLDDFLEQLSKVTTEDKQAACIQRFLDVAQADELECFLLLIKRDLRLNAGVKCLLSALDPKAYEMWKVCSSVPQVVRKVKGIADPDDEEDDAEDVISGEPSRSPSPRPAKGGGGFSLGTPVSPMLARAAKSVEDIINRCPNTAYSEIKYDGERIQIHKDGDSFTFWSRSLKPMKEDKYEGLEKYLVKALKPTQCVVDGEILLVDIKTSRPLPFGTLGKHKKAAFKEANTCIFLFDILYLEGRSLIKETMESRRKLLRDNVEFVHNRVMLSEMQHVKGTPAQQDAMLRKHLQYAILEGLEGLVVKDINGCYEPASRHWIKVKKDYLHGMADSADLVVLGAFFGTGSKGGTMSVFLMGCYDPASSTWKTVCKCGNGHDDATLARINEELKGKVTRINKTPSLRPAWLDCHNHNLPDFVVKDPKDSPVWEIIGAEFTSSKTHTANGISLRFPRVVKIRDDKTWKSATSLPELQKLYEASKTLAKSLGPISFDLMERRLMEEYGEDEPPLSPKAAPPAPAPPPSTPPPSTPPPKLSSPAPQKAAAPSAAAEGKPQATPKQATPKYVVGEPSRPVTTAGNQVVAHCVAQCGKWSAKGSMGSISRSLGDEPQEEYDAVSATLSLGDVQFIKVSNPYSTVGEITVANIVAQHRPSGGPPDFDYDGFSRAFSKVIDFARKHTAAVHLGRVMDKRVNWKKVHQTVLSLSSAHAVPVWVYTKVDTDLKQFNDAPIPVSTPPPSPTPRTSSIEGAKQPSKLASRAETGQFFDDLASVYKGMNVAVNGYGALDTKALKQKITMMGGTPQDNWHSFGGMKTHFLVCETLTEVQDRVDKLGGAIVVRKYVDDCFKQARRLPFDAYLFNPSGDSDEDAPDAPPPKKPRMEEDPPAAPPASGADTAEPPSIFKGCKILLLPSEDDMLADEETELERYVVAHDGDLVSMAQISEATHVVAVGDVPTSLKASLGGKLVRPDWVWKCIASRACVPPEGYRV